MSELESRQIQFLDKDIEKPNRVLRSDVILNRFGQQVDLLATLPVDLAHSAPPRCLRVAPILVRS